MLSDKQIEEYQKIYKSVFGREISKQEAYDQGIKLIQLLKVIYKPMTEDEYAFIMERRRLLTKEDEDMKREIGF
jgi:hypothetical protein